MIEMLSYEFMQRSLAAAVVIGITCSVIGVFVVLKGLSFIGAGTAHSAFAGVAFAFLAGFNPLGTAVLFSLATVWIIGLLQEKGKMKLDVSIGIFYSATMALAVLFIGLMPAFNPELYGYLFGSILSVTPFDLWAISGLGLVVIGTVAVFFKEFHFIAFDQEMAAAGGIPARSLFFILLSLIALTIVVSLKAVGAILVFALLIIPAATAYQIANTITGMIGTAVVFGVTSSVSGVLISFWLDVPSGATIVLLATTIFFLAVWFSPKHKTAKSPAV